MKRLNKWTKMEGIIAQKPQRSDQTAALVDSFSHWTLTD